MQNRLTDVDFDLNDKPLPPLLVWLKRTDLCEIKECLVDLSPLFPDIIGSSNAEIDNFVNQRKKIVAVSLQSQLSASCGNSNESSLNVDELVAMYIYTEEYPPEDDGSNGSLYFKLNSVLRSEKRSDIQPFLKYLKLMMNGLYKLPNVTKRVCRGINIDLSKDLKMKSKNKEFVLFNAFTSCTTNAETLENPMFLKKEGKRTLLFIESKSGKNISPFSSIKAEDEIIFLPSSSFEILQIVTNGDIVVADLKEKDPFENFDEAFNHIYQHHHHQNGMIVKSISSSSSISSLAISEATSTSSSSPIITTRQSNHMNVAGRSDLNSNVTARNLTFQEAEVIPVDNFIFALENHKNHNNSITAAVIYNNLGMHIFGTGKKHVTLSNGETMTEKQCYSKAIELDPTFAMPYYNLGTMTKSQRYFLKAIECDPSFSAAYNNLGTTLSNSKESTVKLNDGRTMTQRECYLKAIECAPTNNSDAYYNLGRTLSNSSRESIILNDGKTRLTKQQCYLKAIECDPCNSNAYQNLATTMSSNNNSEIVTVTIPMIRDPVVVDDDDDDDDDDDIENDHSNFKILTLTKKQCYLKAIECDPKNEYAYRNLALLLKDENDYVVLNDGRRLTKKELIHIKL